MGLLILILGGASVWSLFQLNQAIEAFATEAAQAVDQERKVSQMNLDFRGQVQEWKDLLLRGQNPEKFDKHWKAFVSDEAAVEDKARALSTQIQDPQSHELLTRFLKEHALMGERYREGLEAYKASGFNAASADVRVAGMDRESVAVLRVVSRRLAETAQRIGEEAQRRADHARKWSLVALLVASLAGMGLAWLVHRSVVTLLGGEPAEAKATAHAIAKGDLSRIVPLAPHDTQSLMAALKEMQNGLAGLVSEVRASTDSLATASSQIAAGNQDLATRTQEQASALEQTAATMEQFSASVHTNAEGAQQAKQLALHATEVAQKGREVVRDVVGTIHGIQDSSRKISDIIGLIDSIAFQTNILALNAAVEAARAGEQGRGFAVVAGEVRELAQRSARAAKEIKHLINHSTREVESGTSLVQQAGETMEQVVRSILQVSEIVESISHANQEQFTGVQQIGAAISTLDEATQENAALVEESANVAQKLEHEAFKLVETVSVFKT